MRTKLAAAALVAGLAASFGPTTPASAICIGWYYDLTGQCSPCNTVGVVANVVEDKTGVEPLEMNCVA